MRVITPLNMGVLFKGIAIAGEARLSIAACACFRLEENAPNRLMEEPEMWPLLDAALGPEGIFDFGTPKIRGEYLVYGSAFAPVPVPAIEVSVQVGHMGKILAVFGNRNWGLLGMENPVPFTRMEITYGNAFGGPDFPDNPLGKGTVPDAAGKIPLPNIQDPRRLIGSPGEKQSPAGFNAFPMEWPQRLRHMGKVDEKWLREDWPHFPKDTNWELFNTAPEDQRLKGFLSGDEKISIVNMHPEKPLFTSSLPGLRPRLFVSQRGENGEIFREVACRAETLWLFPDRETGILLYRGTVPVKDEDYEDIIHLYGQWESLSEEPRPSEEYERMFQKAITPPRPDEEANAAPPPETEPGPSPAPPSATAELPPALSALLKDAEELEAKSRAMLKQAGLDPDLAVKRFLPAGERAAAASLGELSAAVMDLEEQTAAFMKKFNISPAAVEKIMTPKPETPTATADEIIANLRKGGFHKPEIEARIREAEAMSREAAAVVDKMGKKEAGVGTAPPPPEVEMPLPAGLVLTVEEVMARHDRGESLRGLDLAGLDFTGRRLAGADFTASVLVGAVFANATLTNAIFKNAILKETDFRNADLNQAILEQADASSGLFQGSRLTEAKLSGGDFTATNFTGADLSGADAAGADFSEAVMEGATAARIRAPRASFAKAILNDANLTEAELTDADFTGAKLTHCAFNRTLAHGLRLNGASGEHTKFGQSHLVASRADGATLLADARFYDADLSDACWEGARLPRAQLIDAVINRGDFSRCDLTGASLVLTTAKEAKFMNADLTNANLTGINLFKGSLRKAVLTRTDLKLSNLYGVDFYRAKMQRTNLDQANIKKTLLKLRQES